MSRSVKFEPVGSNTCVGHNRAGNEKFFKRYCSGVLRKYNNRKIKYYLEDIDDFLLKNKKDECMGIWGYPKDGKSRSRNYSECVKLSRRIRNFRFIKNKLGRTELDDNNIFSYISK